MQRRRLHVEVHGLSRLSGREAPPTGWLIYKLRGRASPPIHSSQCRFPARHNSGVRPWMKIALFLAAVAITSAAQAAPLCEIKGQAVHWAYDACMGRHETDDSLHPRVVACVDRAQRLIRAKGECKAKRIFKKRVCVLLQKTADRRSSLQACMQDPSVVGSTVQKSGL